ncbi:putative bifunctional diguanylate cyclase/phosphodiesterase [Billgrantia gudaonensis]|uniref:cyclic-guanylate-specific phosphodiesterase n=1 Tax=Billgrantia gudaonensis TaxID=376427 RepID=A0A1G9C4J7_9GAMM|nr:bifunctional diguanylate cyclase/phosphodiesterase [Halomonas gudaonensis]SDK46566.1 diguanylate cyclase (GGDEF) domain-containing protein [Halomonas gudaonensis]
MNDSLRLRLLLLLPMLLLLASATLFGIGVWQLPAWMVGAGLAVLLLIASLMAFRLHRQLMVIGDAILALAAPASDLTALTPVEALAGRARGPTGRLASALLRWREAECRRRCAEREVHRLAYYDTLTDLPNWRLMSEHLAHSLELSRRNGTLGALILLDLDHFQRINDSGGYGVGDQLLRKVSERLQRLLDDVAILGRLGGDEFAVVVGALGEKHMTVADRVESLAIRLAETFGAPFEIEGQRHFISASQGIVIFPDGDSDAETLFRHADAAVLRAKQEGRDAACFYDPRVQAVIEARTALEQGLRLAIERQQLCLFYQLQVDVGGKPIGAEALLRWNSPERGRVSPGDFIPLAEETGLIVPIGHWVLEAACRQLVLWQRSPLTAGLTLAVNVSARQFQQPDFVERVANILAHTGADPRRLKLELTESAVIGHVEETIQRMHHLKELGLRFALDDFGTGYSSLQYLKRLPLDQIKIDQSFVRDLHEDPDDRVIVETIIAMGLALDLQIIAEGVETREHWRYLAAQRCHAYQGYYFAKPVPADELNVSGFMGPAESPGPTTQSRHPA